MTGVAGELHALTNEKIIAEANEIRYTSGDTSSNGNTIADQMTTLLNSRQYVTEDVWSDISSTAGKLQLGVEYNVYE